MLLYYLSFKIIMAHDTDVFSSGRIVVRGAREHNLKNISIDLPKDRLVVLTGLSGSGKSSLAFDTIYAEGQRRYVESLSAYARQFLGLMEKPDVDSIDGLSPAISIDQKSASHNPRSTVGTVTEIYDYLRLLFARVGEPHCPICNTLLNAQTVQQIVDSILNFNSKDDSTKLMLLAPIIKSRKGEYEELFNNLLNKGFVRVRVDGIIRNLEEEIKLDKQKKHNIEVIVDRLVLDRNSRSEQEYINSGKTEEDYKNFRQRITDSIETTLHTSDGEVICSVQNGEKWIDHYFSESLVCPNHPQINIPQLEPNMFSFNAPQGACGRCHGLGSIQEIDPHLVYNSSLSILEGAIFPWSRNIDSGSWHIRMLTALSKKIGFDMKKPMEELSQKNLDIILRGEGQKLQVNMDGGKFEGTYQSTYEGVIPNLERRYLESDSDFVRKEIEKFMQRKTCPVCNGARLKDESLAVKIAQKNINQITDLSITNAQKWALELTSEDSILSVSHRVIAKQVLKEINSRLQFLVSVGLDYLTLNRTARTLSGGEAQRIRLASQIGSGLTGVLYVLDEPSIGLHQKDNDRLIQTLKHLRDLGNTVLVVEHDEDTMHASDWMVDMGPGAGEHGGHVIATGTVSDIINTPSSITGPYLSHKSIVGNGIQNKKLTKDTKYLEIIGATEHNLKNVSVKIPLERFISVTGVSGSGKSTLINDILNKYLHNYFWKGNKKVGDFEDIRGVEFIDKQINIDQSPIGRTPRSNPASYVGFFTFIRDLFAATNESKLRGYKPGRFSFNVKGGRCEECRGDGVKKIEMQFLPDVYVTCEICKGKRYNREALEIEFKGKNISDVLNMTVEEGRTYFENVPRVKRHLDTLNEVGLGYMKIGQSATTLSGGEAQRIKLATELSKRSTGKTLYILDEPTTGLHFADVDKLLSVLHQLVHQGNTVLVIEHNLDVIKTSDWIIDLGPQGGEKGGELIIQGTIDDVVNCEQSYTGQYLKKVLKYSH